VKVGGRRGRVGRWSFAKYDVSFVYLGTMSRCGKKIYQRSSERRDLEAKREEMRRNHAEQARRAVARFSFRIQPWGAFKQAVMIQKGQ